MKCSKCDKEMVLRTNKMSGERFWGCPNFPKCKQTASIGDKKSKQGVGWSDYDDLGYFPPDGHY